MQIVTTSVTTIKVLGVPQSWDALEAIKKEMKELDDTAVVDYHDSVDVAKAGFKIELPETPPSIAEDKIVAIVERGIKNAAEAEAATVERNVKFVTDFKWRNIGEIQAEGKFQKLLQDIVVREEESAREAQRTMSPEEAYYAMFDMTAYYDIWDAIFQGGPEHAAKVAQHQDTAVREVFGEFFDLMDDEGRSW